MREQHWALFLLLSCVFLVFSGAALALPLSLSDQGSGVTYNGAVVGDGNLSILIWTSATDSSSASLVFNQTYPDAIQNGSWNIELNNSVLDLEFGREYWKAYAINGSALTFNGASRLPLYASAGIYNGSALAIGFDTFANDTNSTAVGANAVASSAYAIAVGSAALAAAPDALALGANTSVVGIGDIALGDSAQAAGSDSVAIGVTAFAANSFGTAIGPLASANSSSIAIGYLATALSPSSIAIGPSSVANVSWSVAIGAGADAALNASVAIGNGATTTAVNQMVVGSSTVPLNTIIYGSLNISSVLMLKPGSRPSSPAEGMIYYNSSLHMPCYYNSTAWVGFTGNVSC